MSASASEGLPTVPERVRPTLVAFAIVVVAQASVWVLTAQLERVLDEPLITPINASWAAAPFAALAWVASACRWGARRWRRASRVGLVVTALFWLWVAIEGVLAQTVRSGGGADIGLGVVMLALPALVLALMLVVGVASRDRASSE